MKKINLSLLVEQVLRRSKTGEYINAGTAGSSAKAFSAINLEALTPKDHLLRRRKTSVRGITDLNAQTYSFQGSDNLAGVITDAIYAAGMNQEINYTGGG